jgi:predicted restriction endonuclease
MCDIQDERLLVASHIVRWADEPTARGNLANVLCLCKPHDALFENGYLALTDDYEVLKQSRANSEFLASLLAQTDKFYLPANTRPDPRFLQSHRQRHHFPDF